MFAYSPSQKSFIKTSLINDFRADGRQPNQRRLIQIKQNILDNLSGSSFVSIGHSKTDIYTGVKIKVSQCNQGDLPENIVNLQITSMRKLNKQLNDCLAYLQQLLQEHFIDKQRKSFSQFKIPNSKKHYLQIHIQCFILSEPHLSLLEALFYSIKNALLSTTIPKLECFMNEVTNEQSIELINEGSKLILDSVDNFIVVGGIENNRYILDLTPLEFQSVEFVYLIVIRKKKIVGIESLKGSLNSQEIHKICRFATQNSK